MADDAQPPEGQGSDAGGSPYDSYLNTVPEEARPAAEQWFRDTSKGLDAKLQEAAELKKTWEPYEPLRETLQQYDPEAASQLFAWYEQVYSDPQAKKEWLEATYREEGLTAPQAEAAAELEEDGQDGQVSQERLQQLIQELAEQRLAPIQEQMSTIQEEKAVDFETSSIDQAFQQIQSESKLDLSKDQKAVILDLGMPLAFNEKGEELPMGDASWVKAGFDRWKEITAAGQAAFVEDKLGQPSPSLSAGGTPSLRPITSFEDANAAMRERLRQTS